MTEANVVSQLPAPIPAYTLRGAKGTVPFNADPRIAQWQSLQFGLFLHWGVYSLYEGAFEGTPQGIGYPEQIKAWMNIPDEHYLLSAKQWNASDWNPSHICQMAKDAGMTYVMITTKHHDGFCMWDTKTTDFNIVAQSSFGRDPLAELAQECAKHGLKLAFYFSIIDWTQHNAEPYANLNAIPEKMMPYAQAQIEELLTNYGPIAEFWFDMGGPTPDQSQRLADTVRKCQPDTTVMNSRVWNDKGDFEVGGDNDIPPFFQYGPWESVRSIFPVAWSYCTTDKCDRSPETIPGQVRAAIDDLINVMTGGGQFAYNLGPTGNGGFDPYDITVMDGIGQWMKRHPHAITGARPTWIPLPEWGRISTKGNDLYLFPHTWEEGTELHIPGVTNAATTAVIDSTNTALPLRRQGRDLIVTLEGPCPDPIRPVIKVTLDSPLRVLATRTALLDEEADNTFRAIAPASAIVKHRSAKGYSGGFAALDVYIANPTPHPARNLVITLEPETSLSPNPSSLYTLSMGDHQRIISGKEILSGPVETTWTIEPSTVERLRLEYATVPEAHSPYYAAALDISLSSVQVQAFLHSPTPSVPRIISQPSDTSIFPDQHALLTAAVSGWPLPTYLWTRLDAAGNPTSETIPTNSPFLPVASQMHGTYILEASNDMGSAQSEPVVVSLLSAAQQRGSAPTVGAISVETVMGEDMTTSGDGANRIVTLATGSVLGCHVDVSGDPYPTIQWQVLYADSEHWRDLAEENAPTWIRVTDSSLHLAKVRVHVSNAVGTNTSGMVTIHLTSE